MSNYEEMPLKEKLMQIQTALKVNKDQYNKFGNFYYRSCEGILEKVKPLCREHDTVLTVNDTIEVHGDRYYIKATATLHDLASDNAIQSTAYAREAEKKVGMDESQITGSSSSYARKYALNGLFALDDGKDADSDDNRESEKRSVNPTDIPKPEKPKERKDPITEDDIEALKLAKIDIGKLAVYFKTTPKNLTHKQVLEAIAMKKGAK